MSLLGGHVDSVCVNTPDAVGYVKAGQIRALATTTLQRVPQLPDIPTISESGYPGFNVVSWIRQPSFLFAHTSGENLIFLLSSRISPTFCFEKSPISISV